MTNKWFERMVVITLLLIIAVLLFPIIQKIINNVQLGTIKSDVYSKIEQVKNIYLEDNKELDSLVSLPFTIEYTNNSYRTYCDNKEVFLKRKIKIKGNKPISGSITWKDNNAVIVNNLKYKSFTCNKKENEEVECVKNSD